MQTIGSIDEQIARFYAPLILGSLKHGENRLCIWFPYLGKTRTINDILNSNKTLRLVLGQSFSKYKFIYYVGTVSKNNKASEILENIAINLNINIKQNNSNLIDTVSNRCRELINKGLKVVFIGDTLENLATIERQRLFTGISNIVRSDQNNIHSILNINYFEQIESIINRQPSIITLINSIETVPCLPSEILSNFIKNQSQKLNFSITETEIENIKNYTGGILTLTRALLRNKDKNNLELDLKFNAIWKHLPDNYKSVFEKTITNTKVINPNELRILETLRKSGIVDLDIFKDKFILSQTKNPNVLRSILNDWELEVYNLLLKSKNKVVSREKIASAIWGNNEEVDYSDWAVDQKISRFRKKISRYGLDPNFLETVKGKGYKWQL